MTGWKSPLALAGLTLVYLELVSRDVDVAGVPLKLLLLVVTLGLWLINAGGPRRVLAFPLARAVLAVGIGLPIIWMVIAFATRGLGSSVATLNTRDIFEEASRFGYILLYFPLSDLFGGRATRLRTGLVVGPALLLAATTWVLWLMLRYGTPSWANTTNVLTFGGVFGTKEGVTRVFFGSQIFFLPAIGVLVAAYLTGRRALLTLPPAAFLVSALYLAHARGLWLAALAGLAPIALVGTRRVSGLVARAIVPFLGAFLALAVIGTILVLSLGNLPSFLQDASTGQRVGQSSHLFDAFKHSPLVGSGLGAALADGFRRSQESPWSFELTYLQLLFQIGALGLALTLWPLVQVTVLGIRRLASFHEDADGTSDGPPVDAVIAGLGAVVGVYVAAISNPFLLSSFGMTAAALGLALVSGPPEPAESAATAPVRRALQASRRYAAFAVLPVCVVLSVIEFSDSRVTAEELAPIPVVATPAPTPVAPVGGAAHHKRLRAHTVNGLQPAPLWATDGDLSRANEPLYAILPLAQSVAVAREDPNRPRHTRAPRVARVAPEPGAAQYDITRWQSGPAAQADLVVVHDRGDRVSTRVVSLDGHSTTLAHGMVDVRKPQPGNVRTFAVLRTASGAGNRPDVLMIDHSGPGRPVTVTVISGSSGFTKVTRTVNRDLPVAQIWQADAAAAFPRVSSTQPLAGTVGLLFYVADAKARTVAIHPTSAATGFSAFSGERLVQLPDGPATAPVVLTGRLLGHPAAYVIRTVGHHARLNIIPLRL